MKTYVHNKRAACFVVLNGAGARKLPGCAVHHSSRCYRAELTELSGDTEVDTMDPTALTYLAQPFLVKTAGQCNASPMATYNIPKTSASFHTNA